MSLYTSASGRVVNHGSSSSLDTYRLCRRKFKLSRIDGWKQKGKKASLEFGKCIESAVQFYHDNGLKPGDSTDEFRRLWAKWVDQPLIYTSQEEDWRSLNTMGQEMTRLYEILLPTLPIRNPKWQLQFRKKLFPGTQYDDLEFMGYVDLLSTLEDGSRLIIDIKTAKSMLDIAPGMMALDGQLRKYAWVSGIRDVAFLNFVKSANPDVLKKGTTVSILSTVGFAKPGQTLTVFKHVAPREAVPASEGVKASPAVEWMLLAGTEATVRKMDEVLDRVSGKGSTEKKDRIVAAFVAGGKLVSLSRDQITKCRLQMVRGTIPESELPEIGDQIAADTFAIYQAGLKGSFPADGGVRFPNNVCSWCEMRGICTKNNALRDELLVQISSKKEAEEDDWLRELEHDFEEA